MTLITWQNGGPVLRDGKVGTGSACCCGGGCDSSGLNTGDQPDVAITDGGCPCNAGTHSGTYAFASHFAGVWSWDGTTTCEWLDGAPVLANLGVSVTCDGTTGEWVVTVYSYQLDNIPINGELRTKSLTVNAGVLTGTVDVDMYFGNALQCTFTIAFG